MKYAIRRKGLPTDLAPIVPSEAYNTFWQFAAERQNIYFARISNEPQPWTDDEVLLTYKFTNVYRATDRVSQYLLTDVIYRGDQSPSSVFFRIILFKLFNKIGTWKLLKSYFGSVEYSDTLLRECERILNDALSDGVRIYSAAYIMPSGGTDLAGHRKHSAHLRLLERMMHDELASRISACNKMGRAFELLRSYPMLGDFLSYQFVTDLNYSNICDFSEMEFVMPGPGARDGIRKCFRNLGGLNEQEIIKLMAERQQFEFERLGLSFKSLWGRPLQLIDVQNIFCEVSKYTRVAQPEIQGIGERHRIKQKFRKSNEEISCFFPPKWGINEKVKEWQDDQNTLRCKRR